MVSINKSVFDDKVNSDVPISTTARKAASGETVKVTNTAFWGDSDELTIEDEATEINDQNLYRIYEGDKPMGWTTEEGYNALVGDDKPSSVEFFKDNDGNIYEHLGRDRYIKRDSNGNIVERGMSKEDVIKSINPNAYSNNNSNTSTVSKEGFEKWQKEHSFEKFMQERNSNNKNEKDLTNSDNTLQQIDENFWKGTYSEKINNHEDIQLLEDLNYEGVKYKAGTVLMWDTDGYYIKNSKGHSARNVTRSPISESNLKDHFSNIDAKTVERNKAIVDSLKNGDYKNSDFYKNASESTKNFIDEYVKNEGFKLGVKYNTKAENVDPTSLSNNSSDISSVEDNINNQSPINAAISNVVDFVANDVIGVNDLGDGLEINEASSNSISDPSTEQESTTDESVVNSFTNINSVEQINNNDLIRNFDGSNLDLINEQKEKYGARYGIDVSYSQGNIDWSKVAASGVDFANIRAVRRRWGDGELDFDVHAVDNVINAIDNGLDVGLYCYSVPLNEAEAEEEAQKMIDFIEMLPEEYRDKITMPLINDYETSNYKDGQSTRLNGQTTEQRVKNIEAFNKYLNDRGYKTMTYSYESYFKNELGGYDFSNDNNSVWVANFNENVNYNNAYNMFQYTSSGHVDGITENVVDLNVFYPGNGIENESSSNVDVEINEPNVSDVNVLSGNSVDIDMSKIKSVEPHSDVGDNRLSRLQELFPQITSTNINNVSEAEAAAQVTTIDIPIWKNGTEYSTQELTVNKNLKDNYIGAFNELANIKFPIFVPDEDDPDKEKKRTGAYNYRNTSSGSRISDHALGGTVDINPSHNPFVTGPNPDNTEYAITEDVVNIMAKYGFYWGGDWTGGKDYMHFTYTGW